MPLSDVVGGACTRFFCRTLLGCVVLTFGCLSFLHGETPVGGNLSSDTVWTRAGSPYLASGSVWVDAGVTLTIEPGVEVRFFNYGALYVHGRMRAIGSPGAPILFTGAEKTPGSWSGIFVVGADAAAPLVGTALEYAMVEYAGAFVQYANVSVRNSWFRYAAGDGVAFDWDSQAMNAIAEEIRDTDISGCQGFAVSFVRGEGAATSTLRNLTASGNGFDGVELDEGDLSGRAFTLMASGLPYLSRGGFTVEPDATLIIEPGVEIRFTANAELKMEGTLRAIGRADSPITFTGLEKTPGYWLGIWMEQDGSAVLDHTVVEYAVGDIEFLDRSQGIISHSVIRYSSQYGIYLESQADLTPVVERSQIVDHDGYGVGAQTGLVALAANNWWGDPSGPQVDNECNPGGSGSRVSSGVAYRPFLRAPDADPGPVAASDTIQLSLQPQRWFIPADGMTRAWVTVTVRDGAGQPLSGRQAFLRATLGSVVDGGVTDVQGQTRAFVVSSQPGDSRLTAQLFTLAGCTINLGGNAAITFTPPTTGGAFVEEAQAPYLDEAIEIDPEPVVQGVPTVIRITLTNPNPFPVTVDGEVDYGYSGLGLLFGLIGTVQGRVIPPQSTVTIEVSWDPPISGHVCIQFSYTYQPGNPTSNSFTESRNLSIAPGKLAAPEEAAALSKAHAAGEAIEYGHLGADVAWSVPFGETPLSLAWAIDLGVATRGIDQVTSFWDTAIDSLAGLEDPPRQDYQIIATPEHFVFPTVQPGANLPQGRADAFNALLAAALDLFAELRAGEISMDRYGGAAAAGDQDWTAQQAAAVNYYKKQSGAAMIVFADRLDAYLNELRSEGIRDGIVTVEAVRAYQERLRTVGFTSEEREAASLLHISDEEMETHRQFIINAPPESAAGSQMTILANFAAAYRDAGAVLVNTPPPVSLAAGRVRPLKADQAANETANLIRVYTTNVTFLVGNPYKETATIELRVRRVGLPPDWMITLTPAKVTLGPGAKQTVTVSIRPGTASVQGTRPRLAVEGYANGELVGGVAVDVMVPQVVPFQPPK